MSTQTALNDVLESVDATLDQVEAFAAARTAASVPALVTSRVNLALPDWRDDLLASVGLASEVEAAWAAVRPTYQADIASAVTVPALTVLHVSATGDDRAAGTLAAPLKSLERAFQLAPAMAETQIRLLSDIVVSAPEDVIARELMYGRNLEIGPFQRVVICSHETANRRQISFATRAATPPMYASQFGNWPRYFLMSGGSSLALSNLRVVVPWISQNPTTAIGFQVPIQIREVRAPDAPPVISVVDSIIETPGDSSRGRLIAHTPNHTTDAWEFTSSSMAANPRPTAILPFVLWWSNNTWVTSVNPVRGLISMQNSAGNGLNSDNPPRAIAECAYVRTNLTEW